MYGTGSDEILQLAAGAFASVGDEVLFPRFGFSVYPIAARRVGAKPVEAPDRDYATDVDAMLAAVTERTRVVFLANPNNPTGTFASRDEIARRSEAHTSELQSLMRTSYAVFCLKKKKIN